jgi:hypothetical protein
MGSCRWCDEPEPAHPVGTLAAAFRHEFAPSDWRAKQGALANNPNGRVHLPGHEKTADSDTSDQDKRGSKSLTRSRGRRKLTDQQRRESRKRRNEKQRELMRRRRAEERARRRMPLFDGED